MLRLGLQFFAEKTGDTDVDYSKLTYEEKVDLFKNMGVENRYASLLALLEGEEIDTVIKLKQAGVNDNCIEGLVKNLKGEKFKNASKMCDLLCSEKIKKATQGKYEKQLMDILDPSKMSSVTIKSLLTSGLSEEDFIKSVKKLSASTYKLAMNTPNQYLSDIDIEYTTKVDGKYPALPEDVLAKQQKQVSDFFSEHAAELLIALKYMDTDTINQMMDQRTTKFAQTLESLNGLTDENYELLSELTLKCKTKYSEEEKNAYIDKRNKNNKPLNESQLEALQNQTTRDLTAKEKIQLSQVVKIYQNAGLDTSKLWEMSAAGEVGLISAKQVIQEEILKSAGISEDELSKISINKLKFNEEYSYLALIAMNSEEYTSEKNDLYTVIKASVLGDFETFITDETNIYGQTNAKTASAFTQNGIDYEQWLKPDISDVEFDLDGQRMTIKMWDRNPQEDLFMGNKTSCCTAIGANKNAKSTPAYLLNTSYNVVELYDETGEVVGMSRIFMANVNGKPSVIMDNIELNTNYKDTKKTEEAKTKIRDSFFEYMNNFAQHITGDFDSQVYFYPYDIHVPDSDLAHNFITLDFIGNLSQETVYVNSVGCDWIDPTKLSSEGNISFLVVPK